MAIRKPSLESMEIKHILVTGSNGYIGTVLVKKLIDAGYKVTGLDTDYFSHLVIGSLDYSYKTLNKDIRLAHNLDLSSYDAIIHLAALSNDPIGDLDQELTRSINHTATIKLAKKAKKDGVKRFIFSSSCSIYGIAKDGIVTELSEPTPLTTYAESKIESEKELLKLADEKFTVGLMRNSTVYGFSPRFRNDLVVNNFTTCALALKKIKIMSDGTPWRPLIDVRDLSELFIEFLKAPSEKINGEIYNIGFPENNFQVKNLLDTVLRHVPQCEVVYTGEHGSDSRSYRVDFSKLHQRFPHLKQSWPLDVSVGDLIKNLKKNKFTKKDFLSDKFVRLATIKDHQKAGKLSHDLVWLKQKITG